MKIQAVTNFFVLRKIISIIIKIISNLRKIIIFIVLTKIGMVF